MATIKNKEKKLDKRIPPGTVRLNSASKKKLRRPQDNQPIPTVCVS